MPAAVKDLKAALAGSNIEAGAGDTALIEAAERPAEWVLAAIGGTLGGIAGGVAVAWYAGIPNLLAVGILALLLSAASQAGDLIESAIKRRFDAKDASGLIPGHGGVMDRVDGFVIAVTVAAIIGIARGGVETPAQGLLVW